MAYVIGVDVGGTFTDAVLDDDAGTVLAAKSPSTPPDYSQGVLDVLGLLAEQLGKPLPEMLAETHHIAHGTTSSLNALVTGNVPPVGFLTTKGHRDSIFIMNVEGRYLGRSPHELQNVLGQKKDHGLLPKRRCPPRCWRPASKVLMASCCPLPADRILVCSKSPLPRISFKEPRTRMRTSSSAP